MALPSSHSVGCNSGYIKPQQGHQRSLWREHLARPPVRSQEQREIPSGQSGEWKPRGDQQEAAGSRGELTWTGAGGLF